MHHSDEINKFGIFQYFIWYFFGFFFDLKLIFLRYILHEYCAVGSELKFSSLYSVLTEQTVGEQSCLLLFSVKAEEMIINFA